MKTRTSKALQPLVIIIFVLALASVGPRCLGQAAARDADPSVKKGDDLFKSGKYHDAIQAYRDALNKDPENDHALEYTILSYNKMGDREQTRLWMKRRVDLPGQTPSIKARVLTDMAMLYWDEARSDFLKSSAGGEKIKPDDAATIAKLVTEGTESAQKAVGIAPKSAKAFNLLNLLDRVQAEMESDGTKQKELLGRADEALRHSIECYEGSVQQQQSHDMFGAPTVSVPAGQSADGLKLGQAKKIGLGSVQSGKGTAVSVEVLVGLDGRVLYPRVISAPQKLTEAASAAAKQWEFEPSTFEGHAVQVIEVVSFPVK